MTYSVKGTIEERIQAEQSILAEFNSLKKAMDTIVFLGYGNENLLSDTIKIRAANLSLLYYYLWKIFEERGAETESRNTKDFSAVKMFLSPVVRGSWETIKKPEYSGEIKNAFEIFCDASYSDLDAFHNDFYKELEGVYRDSASEAIKKIDFIEKCYSYNLQEAYKILYQSIKAEKANYKLIVILILTSFLCRESFEIGFNISYSESMSLLIRLGLLMGRDTFIRDLTSHSELLDPIQKAIDDYIKMGVLSENNFKEIVSFLFSDIVKGNDKKMLFVEKELFRITQRLFRLAYKWQIREEKKCYCPKITLHEEAIENDKEEIKYKKWLAKILSLLFVTSAEEVYYKLGYDEENFYFLLKRGVFGAKNH